MTENLPDDYEERSRPSRGQIEAEGDRTHDQMANMVARPESLQDYLDHQLSWFDLDDETRRMADRIIYNLDSNGYLEVAAGGPDPAAAGRGERRRRRRGGPSS